MLLAKISKIARFFILTLLFFVGLMYIVFRSSPVQTWITQKLCTYMSDEIGAKISIGGVDIDFFKTAVLEDVYVEDQHHDTLFYFRKLKVDYHSYDENKHIVKLNYLGMTGAKILFGQHKGEKDLNYEFFLDYFDSPRDPSKPKILWTFFSKKVEIENSRFDYFDRNLPKPDFLDFNYNDFSFREINAELNQFYLIDDSLNFQTKYLSTKEKCGFEVLNISAKTKIHWKGIELEDLLLETEKSTIGNTFIMKTESWKSYNNFNDEVTMYGSLKDAKIHTSDLSYFSNNIKSYNTLIEISGEGSGTLRQLKGKNTQMRIFESTKFKGDWSLYGLPDFDNTILDFDIQELETNYSDLQKISLNNVPDNFKTLGPIVYNGNFSGFYNDFIAYGKIKTELGDFDADINIKFKDGLDKGVYSGQLNSNHFKLKSFISFTPVDDISFKLALNGKGLSAESFDLNLDGKIDELVYQGHTFSDIESKGHLKKDFFSGTIVVKDPDLDMVFDGLFQTVNNIPKADFKAQINHFNLASIGLDSVNQIIKGDFDFDFTGRNIDNAQGKIVAQNVSISRNNVQVDIPELLLTSDEILGKREIHCLSDLFDLHIVGDYKLSELDISLMEFAHLLLPAYIKSPQQKSPNEDIDFSFDIKKPNQFTSLYWPDFSMQPFNISGYYHSKKNELNLVTQNREVFYKDIKLNQISLNALKNENEKLNVKVDCKGILNENIVTIKDIQLVSNIYDNIIDFDISAKDTTWKIDLNSNGFFNFYKDSIQLSLKKSDLKINKKLWSLHETSQAYIVQSGFYLQKFKITSLDETLEMRGSYGEKSFNAMNLSLENFNLDIINNFVKDPDIEKFGGVTNGFITYQKKEKLPIYYSDLTINNFSYANDTFGNLLVLTENRGLREPQHLQIKVKEGLLNDLRIEGDVDYFSDKNNLKLHAHLPETNLKVFEPFMKGILSQFKGTLMIKDSLLISGKFSEPQLNGHVLLNNTQVLVDYLNVPIAFNAQILIENNKFVIPEFPIQDRKGGKGKVSGSITHQHLSDFKLNLFLKDLDNFQVLNTNSKDNSLFYGQGYMSGNASLTGPFNQLDIKISGKTMPNTAFYLPINEGDASDLPNYVHFKTPKKRFERKKDDFPLNSLIIDIEANTDANVEIIFDETLGDKITGNGNGNIRMEMNKTGDFYMFGTYKVAQGKYLFTAFDLYNKPFFIRPGGTITWYGDPLDAKLDLVAFHSERANPNPLQIALTLNNSLSTNTSNSNRLVTAESELYLKGNLFTPEISFGLNFPKLQYEIQDDYVALQSVISRIKSDKDEVSRQVFSLLIMKQFLPPTFAENSIGISNAGSQALSTAGSDLLSAQLSNWLNKIDPNWNVNFIYKNGTLTLPAEYGVILSSKFIKDRLSFDGSFSNLTNRPNLNFEYKVTKKGNIKVKAYTRSNFNQVNTTSLNNPITTSGVGVVYTKEFNSISLRNRKKKKKAAKN